MKRRLAVDDATEAHVEPKPLDKCVYAKGNRLGIQSIQRCFGDNLLADIECTIGLALTKFFEDPAVGRAGMALGKKRVPKGDTLAAAAASITSEYSSSTAERAATRSLSLVANRKVRLPYPTPAFFAISAKVVLERPLVPITAIVALMISCSLSSAVFRRLWIFLGDWSMAVTAKALVVRNPAEA